MHENKLLLCRATEGCFVAAAYSYSNPSEECSRTVAQRLCGPGQSSVGWSFGLILTVVPLERQACLSSGSESSPLYEQQPLQADPSLLTVLHPGGGLFMGVGWGGVGGSQLNAQT